MVNELEGMNVAKLKYKKGQQVSVYQDPLTKMELEGTATLVKFIGSDPEIGERWIVQFPDDEFGGEPEVERWIA